MFDLSLSELGVSSWMPVLIDHQLKSVKFVNVFQ